MTVKATVPVLGCSSKAVARLAGCNHLEALNPRKVPWQAQALMLPDTETVTVIVIMNLMLESRGLEAPDVCFIHVYPGNRKTLDNLVQNLSIFKTRLLQGDGSSKPEASVQLQRSIQTHTRTFLYTFMFVMTMYSACHTATNLRNATRDA